MAKDPTQGPVSTYDAEGNPIKTNVDVPDVEEVVEEVVEETAADESGVKETVEEEEAPEEGEAPEEADEEEAPEEEEDEFEIHDLPVPAPLTYNEAETMLMDTSFLKLREIAIAEDIKPKRKKIDVVRQLLDLWFAPSEVPKEEEQPEMSVRIRRAKGLM